MTTDDKERDFTESGALKRPGRIDPIVLNNVDDAGDGQPGLQKALRNWVKYYLDSGAMESAIDMNTKLISNVLDPVGNQDVATKAYVLAQLSEKTYYCNTQAEVTTALAAIGSDMGIIILTGAFTLSSTIAIDGGASYIIVGMGDKVVIDCGGNRSAFNITSAESLFLGDFKILCNDITDTTAVVIVNEGSDNPVVIDKIIIDGTGNGEDAYGFDIDSHNVIVRNCTIKEIRKAFDISGSWCKIEGNIISELDSPAGSGVGGNGTDLSALDNDGFYNDIIGNIIDGVESGAGANGDAGTHGGHAGDIQGIYNAGNYCNIKENTIMNMISGNGGTAVFDSRDGGNGGDARGIYNIGVSNHIDQNKIIALYSGNGGDVKVPPDSGIAGVPGACIGIDNGGNYNSIDDNIIKDLNGGDGADGGAAA